MSPAGPDNVAGESSRVIEKVARESYGRLVAFLAAGSRDVAGAEDALAEALQAALKTWPQTGVPEKPEAWLMATARRRLIDEARRNHVRTRSAPQVEIMLEKAGPTPHAGEFPDERLKLLFVCAHPAIDAAARTPLMLQTVLGFDAGRIASAFLVAPAAMSQRLVRAKARIRATGIPFVVPERHELPDRLEAVFEAIYAAYGTGWDDAFGADAHQRGLADEAVWLARVVIELLPAAAEAHGLLALMLYCEARRPARRATTGGYIPLLAQDTAQWSRPVLAEAEAQLIAAAALRAPGRFQIEAAIQSIHIQRGLTGADLGPQLVNLYDELVRVAPTLGAHVSRAAALGEAIDPAAGLAALKTLPAETIASYQPYWAAQAHLLAQSGRIAEAREAYTRAMGLTEEDAVRRFLMERRDRLA
jgi:RNA polymerase sigma-70 factor, ECF subfamily